MIKKFLKRLGYIHNTELTEEFLGRKYVELIEDVYDYEIDKKVEERFFSDLSMIDNVHSFFKSTVAKDIQRYFSAPDDKQRDTVRGAMARMVYFRTGLKNVKK